MSDFYSFEIIKHVSFFTLLFTNHQSLSHRFLTYQNIYTSVKMLNFWCDFFGDSAAEKVKIMKISDKR